MKPIPPVDLEQFKFSLYLGDATHLPPVDQRPIPIGDSETVTLTNHPLNQWMQAVGDMAIVSRIFALAEMLPCLDETYVKLDKFGVPVMIHESVLEVAATLSTDPRGKFSKRKFLSAIKKIKK